MPKCDKAASQLCSGHRKAPHGHSCATVRGEQLLRELWKEYRVCGLAPAATVRWDKVKGQSTPVLQADGSSPASSPKDWRSGKEGKDAQAAETFHRNAGGTATQGRSFFTAHAGPLCPPSCQDNALKVAETTPTVEWWRMARSPLLLFIG